MRKIFKILGSRSLDTDAEQGQDRSQQAPQVINGDALEYLLNDPNRKRFRNNPEEESQASSHSSPFVQYH